ncbi:MAG: DNA-protecting protein DprA [Planctomycetes bacterium]|nr:DNA-protecting protein DprA [Planctomycetota bacterium]
MATLESLLTLNAVRGIGTVLHRRLLQRFGSIEGILSASERALQAVRGIGPAISGELREAVKKEAGKRERELAGEKGIGILPFDDPAYPAYLRAIYDAPLALYLKGALAPEDLLAVALVGSRHPTFYGAQSAERLAVALAERGVTVVSGLARGVDTAAHRGALKAKGRTLAVLGSGLLRVYPEENAKLFDQVAERGACISELPLRAPPDARNFPRRNRIVSGLSLGVCVVEAKIKSGALITTAWALDQGKDVFAVPGKIDTPHAGGCHALLKQGAKLVETADDILDELGPYVDRLRPPAKEKTAPPVAARLSAPESTLYGCLSSEPMTIDELIDATSLPPATVSGSLLFLEMKNLVRQLPGKNFVRV